MANEYDVIVIGAGHNGLTAAASLARGGRSVLVLERREDFGGTASTIEFAPDFRSSACFATAELFHPEIARELDLVGNGLELRQAPGGTLVPLPDGGGLRLGEDAGVPDALAPLSAADSAAFAAFNGLLRRVAAALGPVMSRPLPAIDPARAADAFELLTLGLRLRRLGKRDMPEALRLMPMAAEDVLAERFETPALQVAMAIPGLVSSWLGPKSPGSALGMLQQRPAWAGGTFPAPVFVTGGLGQLAAALAAVVKAAGGKIRTGAEVARIESADCRVTGVVLDNGEEIRARRVVSAVDARSTMLGMLAPGQLETDFADQVRDIRMRGSVAAVLFATDRLPAWRGVDGNGAGRVLIGDDLEYLERTFDNVKWGTIPTSPWLDVTLPTTVDRSLAPEGKHVIHVWAQSVPYELAEGTWDGRRDELGNRVVETIERYAPGFSETILHRRVLTPLDIERDWGLTGGHLFHGEPALDQSLYLRPVPGWYRHATPVRGLYLCGPGCHPGGGVTGLPGRNAATRVLKEWGDIGSA